MVNRSAIEISVENNHNIFEHIVQAFTDTHTQL